MEMEDGEFVNKNKNKNVMNLLPRPATSDYTLKKSLRYEHAFNIIEALVWKSYYTGKQNEFMGLTNPNLDKDFTFVPRKKHVTLWSRTYLLSTTINSK